MHKGVRVPESGDLSGRYRDQIRKVVREHAKTHDIKLRSIAVQVGVGESTISEVLKGSYRGDADKILRQLNAWVEDDAARRSRSTPIGFYDTSIFKCVRDAAKIVKNQADTEPQNSVGGDKARIAVVFGPSGCGKSEAGKALCINDPNAIYVRVRSSCRGGAAFARAIYMAAGWHSRRVHQSYMDALFDKLAYSGRLLVIDEGHKLTEAALDFLRDLNDICKIPILILATQSLHERVERTRRGVGNIMDDQFSSRVYIQFDLLRGTDGKGGDKRPIFSLDEVAAIFKDDEVRLSDDGLLMLCGIACTLGQGMLRVAASIFEKARVKARRRSDKTIDAELILEAAKLAMLAPGFSFTNGGQAIYQQIMTSVELVRRLTPAPEPRKATAG